MKYGLKDQYKNKWNRVGSIKIQNSHSLSQTIQKRKDPNKIRGERKGY